MLLEVVVEAPDQRVLAKDRPVEGRVRLLQQRLNVVAPPIAQVENVPVVGPILQRRIPSQTS